ncbi:MAG: endonuclease/exonuclease/phosphatase family protein [Akkermansiaceae bacterium]
MSILRRRLGWTLVAASLLLHLFTVYTFARQPDRFAAFTVVPIWLWGGAGLALSSGAFYFLRGAPPLIMTGIWAITLLVGADEARVLTHGGNAAPRPGQPEKHRGQAVIRVVTLNCALFNYGAHGAALPTELAAWQPDIVLLQDAWPYQVRQFADALYGGHGDYRVHLTNGIVSRWKIQREIPKSGQDRSQQVRILLPGGAEIEVVNVHLASAATDLRLWRRAAWGEHRVNRLDRQQELAHICQVLAQTTPFPEHPTLFGGDFNAPATDIVHRQLAPDFVDSFAAAGTGWGNTYQRRFPILRIDHLYATRHFVPVRSRAITTRHSDHRMVVTDFLAAPLDGR